MNNLTKLVFASCEHGDALQFNAEGLIKLAQTMPYTKYRNAVAVAVGQYYTGKTGEMVKPHPSQLNKAWLTFEKNSAPYQRLKALAKLHPNQPATSSGHREPVVVPKRLVTQTRDAIVAQGLTKAQFDAFVRELRESLTF